MASSPDLQEPQIAAARSAAWHQAGDRLLTLEAARTWLNQYGLVLFASRSAQLGAPAPSLVEATLGQAQAGTTLAETQTARALTARLVGEGSALPLNLLGGPGDVPDFLVSAQAFPFVFTLRGDKGWKRPPETSGSVKVTPLALRVYEVLAERGSMTVAELLPEIGREVTESAAARALSELWQILRVIPVLQAGEGETIWELTTTRFLKTIKAGANAGQPTAISALISLYLTQALVASEEEIAGFLSPLTARSRVRDVLHGLGAGRQLEEGVVNGKTVVYLPEGLPDFAGMSQEDDQELTDEQAEGADTDQAEIGDEQGKSGDQGEESNAGDVTAAPRIRRFEGEGSGPADRSLRGQPFRPAGGSGDRPRKQGFPRGERPDRTGGGSERRPFRPAGDRPERVGGFRGDRPGPQGDRPSFARPWDEERGSRPPRPRSEGAGDRPERRPSRSAEGGDQPARSFRDRGAGRPPRSDSRPPRREGGSAFPRREGSGFPRREGGNAGRDDRAKRPFSPRADRGPREDRPARPFRPRPEGEDRAARRDRGGDRPFRPRPAGGDRPFRPRPEGGDRPFRPRPEGGDRPFRPRAEGGDRPFRPRAEGGDRPFRPRPEGGDRPFRPRPEGGDRPFRPRPEGGDRPFRPREGGASGRPRSGGAPAGRFGAGVRPGGFTRRPEGEQGADRGPRAGGGFSRDRGPGSSRGPGRPGGGSGFGGPRSGGGGSRPAAGGRSGNFGSRPDRPARSDRSSRPDRPARPPRGPRPEDEA